VQCDHSSNRAVYNPGDSEMLFRGVHIVPGSWGIRSLSGKEMWELVPGKETNTKVVDVQGIASQNQEPTSQTSL